jgi:hypothetical protein
MGARKASFTDSIQDHTHAFMPRPTPHTKEPHMPDDPKPAADKTKPPTDFTMRDKIALTALQGLLAGGDDRGDQEVVATAFDIASAFIMHRKRQSAGRYEV